MPGAADDDGGTTESFEDTSKLVAAAGEYSVAPLKYAILIDHIVFLIEQQPAHLSFCVLSF